MKRLAAINTDCSISMVHMCDSGCSEVALRLVVSAWKPSRLLADTEKVTGLAFIDVPTWEGFFFNYFGKIFVLCGFSASTGIPTVLDSWHSLNDYFKASHLI